MDAFRFFWIFHGIDKPILLQYMYSYPDSPATQKRFFRASRLFCISILLLISENHNSPYMLILFCITEMLYCCGVICGVTSSHESGVETGAPGLGRSEYGEAIVLPFTFCK